MKTLFVMLALAVTAFAQGAFKPAQPVDLSAGRLIPPQATFASAPASPATGQEFTFTDASAAGVCTGGGTALAKCRYNGSGWDAVSGGSGTGTGNVVGPASATADNVPQFSGTTGKILKDGFAVSQAATNNAIAQRNASGEVIATNTVATGKTPMATDTVTTAAQEPAHTGDVTNSAGSLALALAAQYKVRTCEIAVGDPGAASSVLADDNDSPAVCGNLTGATMTITEVKCAAFPSNTGAPTALPIITAGASNSILSSAIACGNATFGSAGTLNGTPTQADGASIDGNIATAGGTAKYIVIRIKRTL